MGRVPRYVREFLIEGVTEAAARLARPLLSEIFGGRVAPGEELQTYSVGAIKAAPKGCVVELGIPRCIDTIKAERDLRAAIAAAPGHKMCAPVVDEEEESAPQAAKKATKKGRGSK